MNIYVRNMNNRRNKAGYNMAMLPSKKRLYIKWQWFNTEWQSFENTVVMIWRMAII